MRRAFTMFELLITVLILVILLALLVPALIKARDIGRTAVCLSNLRQIGMCSFGYANDNLGMIVPMGYWDANASGTVPYGMRDTFANIFVDGGYFKMPSVKLNDGITSRPSIFMCPLTRTDAFYPGGTSTPTSRTDVAGSALPARYYSTISKSYLDVGYATNALSTDIGGQPWTSTPCRKLPKDNTGPTYSTPAVYMFTALNNIRVPGNMVFMLDGTTSNFGNNPNRINARHTKQTVTNISFYDGHASSVRTNTIPTKWDLTTLATFPGNLMWRLDQ